MSEEYLPSRFKRSNVDRFVPFIKRVLNGEATVRIKHATLGLNANTCEHRVRDAVNAFINGIVFDPDVDSTRLREAWSLRKVYRDEVTHEIIIELKQKSSGLIITSDFLDAELTVAHPYFKDILEAYATLYNWEVYKGRLHILGYLEPELEQYIKQKYVRVMFTHITPMEHYLS